MAARCGVLLGALLLIGLGGFTRWSASAAEAGQTHEVTIEGMRFSPAIVRIRPGDRVTFTNRDLVPHTATSKDVKVFDSGIIPPGRSWTLNAPGGESVRYVCTFHPTMEGEIIVDPPRP